MDKIVFVDVDDTLVRSVGTKRIGMPSVISCIRQMQDAGVSLYLWCSGGAQYCEATAAELGISTCFSRLLPKPTIYIDDQLVAEWRFCKHFYPSRADRAMM